MKCHFTDRLCDGAAIYADGTVGCAFKEKFFDECDLLEDVPEGKDPKQWYKQQIKNLVIGGK